MQRETRYMPLPLVARRSSVRVIVPLVIVVRVILSRVLVARRVVSRLQVSARVQFSSSLSGLIWSLFIRDLKCQRNVAVCFLIFVAVAGIVGALTLTNLTLFVQTLPAMLALFVGFLAFKALRDTPQ